MRAGKSGRTNSSRSAAIFPVSEAGQSSLQPPKAFPARSDHVSYCPPPPDPGSSRSVDLAACGVRAGLRGRGARFSARLLVCNPGHAAAGRDWCRGNDRSDGRGRRKPRHKPCGADRGRNLERSIGRRPPPRRSRGGDCGGASRPDGEAPRCGGSILTRYAASISRPPRGQRLRRGFPNGKCQR